MNEQICLPGGEDFRTSPRDPSEGFRFCRPLEMVTYFRLRVLQFRSILHALKSSSADVLTFDV